MRFFKRKPKRLSDAEYEALIRRIELVSSGEEPLAVSQIAEAPQKPGKPQIEVEGERPGKLMERLGRYAGSFDLDDLPSYGESGDGDEPDDLPSCGESEDDDEPDDLSSCDDESAAFAPDDDPDDILSRGGYAYLSIEDDDNSSDDDDLFALSSDGEDDLAELSSEDDGDFAFAPDEDRDDILSHGGSAYCSRGFEGEPEDEPEDEQENEPKDEPEDEPDLDISDAPTRRAVPKRRIAEDVVRDKKSLAKRGEAQKSARGDPAGLNAAPAVRAGDAGLDRSLDDTLKSLDESFQQMLLRKIDEAGITDADCYKSARIDRKHFSKIRKNPTYKPTKPTAIQFGIALRLSSADFGDLLKKAGYVLSRSSKFDVIVDFYVSRGIYDIDRINSALYKFDQPLLAY